MLGVAYSYQAGWFGLQLNWTILIDLFTTVAITWIGVHECYRANGQNLGRDLILRLAVLGVPLGIRLWFVSLFLYGLNWFGFAPFMQTGLFASPERAWHFLTFLLWNGTAAIFWWRMHHHIKVLNRLSENSALPK